jgi:HAD superfamily hydrolase (TIGR01509 family)
VDVPTAVTFDAGQTLIDLDTDMLSARVAERGALVGAGALSAALPGAWQQYNRLVQAGARHPWKCLMDALLTGASDALARDEAARAAIVDWLWTEQPGRNLWRKPVPGMIELVDDLRAAGVIVAVISNSEGKLAALFDEIGWAGRFALVTDSGVLGIEKPLPGIFTWTCDRLGVSPSSVVHIGDSRAADVDGAVAIGMRAVWFGPPAHDVGDDRVRACADAAGLRAALRGWGLPA